MTSLLRLSPKPSFEAQPGLERPLCRTSGSQGALALGRKRPVRAEPKLLSGHHLVDSPLASPSGTAANLIAVIESKRGAWSASALAESLGCSGKHICALAKTGRIPFPSGREGPAVA
jgi:hypothetical protein